MVHIAPVDPHHDAGFRAWYEAFHAAAIAGRRAALVAQYEELAQSLRKPNPENHRLPFAAFDGDDVAGAMLLEFPQIENHELCEWTILVPPRYRRQGVATRLYEYGMRLATEAKRTTHTAEIDVPSGVELPDCPGSAFALRLGFSSEHHEDHFVLPLPVPREKLDDLRAAGQESHLGYQFESWHGACPQKYAAALADMYTTMERDVPTGTLSHEPKVWDVDRLRASENRLAAQGFESITTAARAPGGEFAGYSQLFLPGHNPGEVMQDDTLVISDYRGHRLGAELKVRNLELLQSHSSTRHQVHTWVAGSNDAMRHINAALGFEPVEQTHEFERIDNE